MRKGKKLSLAIQALREIACAEPGEEDQNSPGLMRYCNGCGSLISIARESLENLEIYK